MFAGLIQRAVLGSAPAVAATGGLGPEIVIDGTFTNTANWTKDAGWAVTGGQAVSSGSNGFVWQPNAGIVAGHTYRVTFTLSGYSAGLMNAYLGDLKTTGTARFTDDTYTQDITPTGADELGIRGAGAGSDPSFIGNISNFSVKEVL